jgi:hypothetical protein
MTNYIYPPLDSNPDTLYQGFVTFMQANIPGWQPYSGELDDWLARAFAAIAAQLTEISSDVATSIYRWFGAYIVSVPPIAAQSAQTLTTWTMQDTAGYTIPAFTQFTLTDPTGAQQGFETATATVVPNGTLTASNVHAVATVAGSAGNGCVGPATNVPLAFVPLGGVVTASPTSQGSDDETDEAYLTRLTNTFQTLSPKPITTEDFSAIVLDQPLVGRVTTLPGFNPVNATQTGNTHTSTTIDTLSNVSRIPQGALISGSGIPGGAFVQSVNIGGSSITISAATTTTLTGTTLTIGGSLNNGGMVGSIVTALDGTALSSPEMAVIQAVIQAQLLAGVLFSVTAPTYTAISIAATVYAWPGQVQADVQAAVSAALSAALTALQWGLQIGGGESAGQWFNDPVIRLSVMEYVMMQVPGVHYVSTLTINTVAADLPLAGIVPLPTPGTMTITVNTG